MPETYEREVKQYPTSPEGYELLETIGKGSSGTVWRAKCVPLNSEVAIKILDLEHCKSNSLDAIRKEIQAMNFCHHPNVVEYHTSFVSDQTLWIIMDYLSAGSCADIIRFAFPGGLEEHLIATILRESLKGMAYFHKAGRVHRDIKAGNILIDGDGTVQIGDFGVSAAFDSGERSRHTFVGTPCWMAPEIVEQTSYDYAVDMWSFGITALELAHGKAPFQEYPPMQVLMMVLSNAPPSLDDKDDDKFSSAFKDVVEKCLQKDPAKRPTAAKLLEHKFFGKFAKKPDYIITHLLSRLPPLGERWRMMNSASAFDIFRNSSSTQLVDMEGDTQAVWEFPSDNSSASSESSLGKLQTILPPTVRSPSSTPSPSTPTPAPSTPTSQAVAPASSTSSLSSVLTAPTTTTAAAAAAATSPAAQVQSTTSPTPAQSQSPPLSPSPSPSLSPSPPAVAVPSSQVPPPQVPSPPLATQSQPKVDPQDVTSPTRKSSDSLLSSDSGSFRNVSPAVSSVNTNGNIASPIPRRNRSANNLVLLAASGELEKQAQVSLNGHHHHHREKSESQLQGSTNGSSGQHRHHGSHHREKSESNLVTSPAATEDKESSKTKSMRAGRFTVTPIVESPLSDSPTHSPTNSVSPTNSSETSHTLDESAPVRSNSPGIRTSSRPASPTNDAESEMSMSEDRSGRHHSSKHKDHTSSKHKHKDHKDSHKHSHKHSHSHRGDTLRESSNGNLRESSSNLLVSPVVSPTTVNSSTNSVGAGGANPLAVSQETPVVPGVVLEQQMQMLAMLVQQQQQQLMQMTLRTSMNNVQPQTPDSQLSTSLALVNELQEQLSYLRKENEHLKQENARLKQLLPADQQ